ncbi:ATPase [Vibrio astriarenae]|nr:ATPase [Vibrio sp. C7]
MDKATSINYLFQPLESWLNDDNVTEIVINRPEEVWIESRSQWTRFSVPELTFDRLMSMATATAAYSDNYIAVSTPMLSAMLPKGERAQFVIPPACEAQTVSVTIRKPSPFSRTLSDYRHDGFFEHVRPIEMALTPHDKHLLELKSTDIEAFLTLAVQLEKNIVIAGGTGSGKPRS